METKYQAVLDEYDSITAELSRGPDGQQLKKLGKRQSEISLLVEKIREYQKLEQELKEASDISSDAGVDKDMRLLADEQIASLTEKKASLESEIDELLLPRDPLDDNSVVVEIRAAAGGDESTLFAAELYRMYIKFSEHKKWKSSLVETSRSEVGGYKEVVFEVIGAGAYGMLKFESGVHRVQRVPDTEKQGRVHTSTVTVAVLPLIEEDDFKIDPKDVKVETSTSRGAGGQSVNTTYSAIKATHLPTGITASSQDERSQQQNRQKALAVLTARVFAHIEEQKRKELSEKRLSQIGTGDRSEKIRTYNFPQDRITDHRINKNWSQVTEVINGKLEPIVEALQEENKRLQKLKM